MSRYLVRRLLIALPTLLVMSFVVFMVLALAPGDPLSQFASNPSVPPEVSANLRHALGLDQPWPVRYVRWLTNVVTRGDLGYSFASRLPVTTVIMMRLPPTLEIVGVAYLIGWLLAIPIGIISAVKQYSLLDHVVSTAALIGFALPTFFTGLVLILVFGVWLHWFPWIYDSTLKIVDWPSLGQFIKQMVLPVAVLGLYQMATMARYTRSSMLDNLPLDYVRTARGKGLKERAVIIGHVLRNSLIPVVTLMALAVPNVFTGALVTEQIFRVPGIGALLVTSVGTSDTPVIMAITMTYAVLVIIFTLLADFLYALLDPRIQYS